MRWKNSKATESADSESFIIFRQNGWLTFSPSDRVEPYMKKPIELKKRIERKMHGADSHQRGQKPVFGNGDRAQIITFKEQFQLIFVVEIGSHSFATISEAGNKEARVSMKRVFQIPTIRHSFLLS